MLSAEKRTKLDDEAFLGGLFQDVGMLGMMAAMGPEYDRILESIPGHEWLVEAEHNALGTDHAAVGAAMSEAWSLPKQLVASIASHHKPEGAPDIDQPVARLVWASRLMANVLVAHDTDEAAYVARAALETHFGIGAGRMQKLLGQLAHEADTLAELFDVEVLSADQMQQTLVQAQEALLQAALDADAEASRLRGLNRELAETAGTDRLTGLHNRTRLEEVMGPMFDEAQDSGRPLAALFIDADRFKSVNDMYGHGVGDEVLRALGGVVKGFCGDAAYRYGGEEILCLLPDYDLDQAVALAEDIRRAVQAEGINAPDCIIRVSVSVGVAVMDEEFCVRSMEELITAADQALYAAKESGRNRVCVAETVPAQ